VDGLDVDSLSLAEVIASIEERLAVTIADEDAATLTTVGPTVNPRTDR
jgi:acyl carrier protein